MESFFPILIIWLVVAVVGNISKKKNAARKSGLAGSRPQAAPGEKRAVPPVSTVPQARPARNARQQMQTAAKPSVSPAPPTETHHAEPLTAHMHEPIMGEEGVGTEGIDCCHEFMLDNPPQEDGELPILTEKTEDERAKALLQGVIFSEILGRRRIKRYGGQRT